MKTSTQKWVKRLIAAFVHGGAAAVTGSVGAALFAPKELSPVTQTLTFIEFVTCCFIGNGVIGFFKQLQDTPIPTDDTQIITKINTP